MAIHLRENQYQGVNAHLCSYLQQHNDWSMFHSNHIVDIQQALQVVLPPESGYFVVSERSIQLVRDDLITGRADVSRHIPDVGVYKSHDFPTGISSTQAVAPGAVVPITDTLNEPEHVVGVAIYQANDESPLGKLVTRIELLSPANKPPGSHYRQYLAKRDETLYAGINLVEIDYLHERRSPLAFLPDYSRHEPKSYPYVNLVSVPYPSLAEGSTRIYGFRVDDPIPAIEIPLVGNDSVTLDLGAVYNHTFFSNPTYGLRLVDYEHLPEGFEMYDAEDQQRIRARMAGV
jgi:hypothetical protein